MDSSQNDNGTTALRHRQQQRKAQIFPESAVERQPFVFSTQLGPTDNDKQKLLHSFNNDSMDFSVIEYDRSVAFSAGVATNSRGFVRRTRRSTSGTTRSINTANTDGSTSDSRLRAAGRSSRARRPRNDNNASDPTLTTIGNDSNEFHGAPEDANTGLAPFLQLSIAFTAGLADEESYDGSAYREFASFTEHAAEAVAVQVSRSAASPCSNGRRRRRPSYARRPSGSISANSAPTDNRKARTKSSPRPPRSGSHRRLQPKQGISIGSNLATLAEQARASIECPICLVHYDENADRVPCTMRCGHSMCLSHAKEVGGSCPICRSSFHGQSLKKSVGLCDAAAAINSMVAALALS